MSRRRPRAPPIDRFTGSWAYLSNFYELTTPLLMRGVAYRTVEHAFQAAKTLDESLRQQIAAAATPGRAKRLGRSLELRPGWDEMRLDVMAALVERKFSDPWLRLRLKATGDRELIEGNTWGDRFWGVDATTGAGFNHLGRILMRVRASIGDS